MTQHHADSVDLRGLARTVLAEHERTRTRGWWAAWQVTPPRGLFSEADACFIEGATPERVLGLLDEIERLRAEVERHRNANLIRAVTDGIEPEWVTDIVNSKGFDRVPWMIAEKASAESREYRRLWIGAGDD